MLLLLDIGNTHTHVALGRGGRLTRAANFPTAAWRDGRMISSLAEHVGSARITAIALCSVVPGATRRAARSLRQHWGVEPFQLTAKTLRGLGIDYPKPSSIGPDRLANAVAARSLY